MGTVTRLELVFVAPSYATDKQGEGRDRARSGPTGGGAHTHEQTRRPQHVLAPCLLCLVPNHCGQGDVGRGVVGDPRMPTAKDV